MRLLACLLVAGSLSAQDVKSIAALALSSPPEFAADALLRLVESGKVTEKAARRQMIEDGFKLAGSARFRVPMHAVSGVGPDTRAGSLDKAYRLKLDTLSLQLRAVRAMEGVDKLAARDMLSAIPPPVVEALPCDSPLAYDLPPEQMPVTPARACEKPAPVTEAYWTSPAAKQIMERATALRFQNGPVVSEEERATSRWQQQLADFLPSLDSWSASDEKSEADYYHQKSIVYESLIELTPPGPERDKLLQAFIGFIGNSNMQSQSPAEWFVHAKAMVERVRNTNGGEPAKVLAALEASGNPALAVYVALERAFGSQTPSWATSGTR